MHRGRPFTLLFLLLVLPAGWTRAVEVQLPLEGYYRPGQYMPVRITAPPGTAGRLVIESAQAVSTAITLADGAAGVVIPFLPIDSIRQVRWRLGEADAWQTLAVQWRALDFDQRVVGFTAVDMDLARSLFPDETIIPVRLDPTQPLPGSLTAWETLDALVIDNPSLLNDAMLGQLLGGQVTVAVRTDLRPDERWPWRQMGQYWVLSHDSAGPARAAEYPAALAAVQGWRADWPAAFRQRIVLYAVGFGVLAMGVALVRWRWTPMAIVILAAATVAGLGLWWSGRSPVVQRGGHVLILGEEMTQIDTWTYRATARGTADRIPFAPLMRPFFEMPEQDRFMRLTLQCSADGMPQAFEYQLPPSLKSAFVSRRIEPWRGRFDPESAEGSPLLRLAQRTYIRPHHKVWGLVNSVPPNPWDASEAEWWGTLVIEVVPRELRP